MKARRQKLKHKKFADVVSHSSPAKRESGRHPGSLAASAAFRRNRRLPSALWDDKLESRKFFSAALLRFAFIPEKHLASLFFSVKEAKLLSELDSVRGAYQ